MTAATRNRHPIALGAVVLALLLAAACSGGDSTDGSGSGSGSGGSGGAEPAAFAPVSVEGASLPAFESTVDDAAIGQAAPTLVGEAPDGTPTEVGAAGEPSLVAFLAHWCPHCQAELPLLVDLADGGAFDGVRAVAVLTGTNTDAPNYPPAAWLEDEGWAGDVLVDDEASTAAQAYGLTGYPFLVVLDADGKVVARASGELPADAVAELVDSART